MANHGDVLFSISVFFSDYYLIVPACIFAFIGAHAVGQGAVIWVFISEIFPNRHRAEGQSLGSFTHWMFAGLLTTFFPKMASSLPPGYVFSFFAGMMCLQLLWVKMIVPETKNVPLEELQKEMGRNTTAYAEARPSLRPFLLL